MALLKKEKVCSVEEYLKDGQKKKAYYRVGELLTFRNDQTGEDYQRLKLSMFPGTTFAIFEDDKKDDQRGF